MQCNMSEQRYTKEWWTKQTYNDHLPRSVKLKRLAWIVAWGACAKWMPYFVGRKWRVRLLRWFGMKDEGNVGFYPSAKVWAPWNLELGSFVAIDDEVNLYSAAKIKIERRSLFHARRLFVPLRTILPSRIVRLSQLRLLSVMASGLVLARRFFPV